MPRNREFVYQCNSLPNEQDDEANDGNVADLEPNNSSEKVSIELDPLVIELNIVNISLDADNEGEWVFNEKPIFEYVLSSSSDTSGNEDVLIKKLNKRSAQHVPAAQI